MENLILLRNPYYLYLLKDDLDPFPNRNMNSKRPQQVTESISARDNVDDKSLDMVSQIQRIHKHASEGVLDDKTRYDAVIAVRGLLSCLEKPEEIVMRQAFEVLDNSRSWIRD